VSTAWRQNGTPGSEPPFVLCWHRRGNPLPVRVIRCPSRARAPAANGDAPVWLLTGATGEPFDFCGHVRRLCADIVRRCEPLRHIDVSRLLLAVTQARSSRVHGLQARVTPLRFPEGRLVRQRRGVSYQVQRFFVDDREIFYLMTFCLPRFLNQAFDDKFVTLFHELYHIGPAFDGDLRRHNGRYAIHSRSQRHYDAHMAQLARSYLADGADPNLHAFLRLDFGQLQRRHGSVVGIVVPRPKLLPVSLPRS
jgi:hypothetical protein